MDYQKLVATEASVDGTYVVDKLNVHANSAPQVGSFLTFSGGALNGFSARVWDNNRAGGKLFYAPVSVPNTPGIGQLVHQTNLRGVGFTPEEIYDELNSSIRFSYPEYKQMTALASFTFDSSIPYIDLGVLGYDGVAKIEWQSPDVGWETVPPASGEGADGWFASPHDGRIWFYGSWPFRLANYPMRVTAFGPAPLLTTNASLTEVPPEWLVVETCYRLLRSGVLRDPQRFTIAQEMAARRERLAASIRTRTTSDQQTVRLV